MIGDFIVFEGLDGVGKTPIAMATVEYLSKKYPDLQFEYIHPLRLTDFGSDVLKLAEKYHFPDPEGDVHDKRPLSIKATRALMVDALYHASSIIKDKLFKGINIICDRWIYSTMVYQPNYTVRDGKVKHSMDDIYSFDSCIDMADFVVLLESKDINIRNLEKAKLYHESMNYVSRSISCYSSISMLEDDSIKLTTEELIMGCKANNNYVNNERNYVKNEKEGGFIERLEEELNKRRK